MAIDVLTLAGFTFDGFSTPNKMMGGGKQAMVVHKLPGGERSIDTLGPDEADIAWSGEFFGNYAYSNALMLDSIRAAGQVVPLTWGGQDRSVIVSEFIYHVRRMPAWVEYSITCTVYQNPALGILTSSPSTMDSLVSSDLGTASAAAATPADALAAGTAPL